MTSFVHVTKMLKLLIFMIFCKHFTTPFLIDYASTKMMTVNETDTYFGYSVLLQKGNPPAVIVGAPRQIRGSKNSGSVYKCDLNSLRCVEYRAISTVKGTYPRHKNGDFIGSVLDGDETVGGKVFTCASRFISDADYHITGRCYLIMHSNNVNEVARVFLPLNSEPLVSSVQGITYYDAAFGEAGLSIAYSKDENILLIGSPGKSLWIGGMIRTSIISYKSEVFSPPPASISKYHYNYIGYSVAWGRFVRNSKVVWYLAGSPRGNDLKGNVLFYDGRNSQVRLPLLGEEVGSYFGASLLVLHNKRQGDAVLIGAPMYSGSSWDEGCVYYYKNKNDTLGNFYPPVKLSSEKASSRFGTSMSAVGDIDLDSFDDCAISAPYEDDGVGAVYIYFGTATGFSKDKYYRISPSHFSAVYPRIVVRGFGMGLSRGNDVDYNKHNDIAIGAYQTGQVFYFKTKQLFDVTMNITSNLKILYTSTKNFSVTNCIMFKFRNDDRIKTLSFFTRIALDDNRVFNKENFTKVVTIKAGDIHCRTETLLLKINHLNVDPLIIFYGYKLNDSKDSLIEKMHSIPVSYECGEDNVCHTNLSVKTKIIDTSNIVIGKHNELKVNVTISNTGESAYQTKLYLTIPPEISLINLRECDLKNGSYVCLIAQILEGEIEKSFLLDLANLASSWKSVRISFKVESNGQDVDASDNEVLLDIPVVLQNNPYLESRSVPETIFLNQSENFLKLTHSFLVGNQGPSPLDLHLVVFIPQMKVNGKDILEIKNLDGNINGIESKCGISNEMLPNVSIPQLPQDNDAKILNCTNSSDHCISMLCIGGYLPKSNKNAVFTLKLTIRVGSTVKFFEDTNSITKLFVVSSAFFTNGTEEFFAASSTLIFAVPKTDVIPLWVYLVTILSGLILLLLLIFILYKCNFFKRTYKEMMENEMSTGIEEDQTEDIDNTDENKN